MHNHRKIESLEIFEKKFSILQEISNIIVATDNINAIANLMLDLAINYTKAEKGSLMLVNEREELYILASRGIDKQLVKNYRAKIGEGVAGKVAKDLCPVRVEDIDKDVRFKREKRDRYKTKSFISCPIIIKNKLIGVLNTNDKKDNSSFTEDELSLIITISNQAAIALENAFLVNQLKVKAAELEEMNSKLIEADVVKTEFLARVSHELRTPLNSIKGSVYYLDQSDKLSRTEQKEFIDIISNETGKLVSAVETQLDFLRLEDESRTINKSVINILDVMNDVQNSKSLSTVLTKCNIKLFIEHKDNISEIIGDKIRTVQLFINLIEGLTDFLLPGDTIKCIITQTDFVKIQLLIPHNLPEAILPHFFSSSRLFQSNPQDKKFKLYLAMKIVDIHGWNLTYENNTNGFYVSLNIPINKQEKQDAAINSSISQYLEFIAEVLGLDICSIMLNDNITGDLTIKSAIGLDENIIRRTRIRQGDQICGWVAREGKPLLIENIETDPRFGRSSISQYNTKSLVSIPLKVNDKVIGVLNLNNKKSATPFSEKDLHLATILSERVANFIGKSYITDFLDEDFKQLTTSFDNLLKAEKKYHKKLGLCPDIIERIMDLVESTEEEKELAVYVSRIYDLGIMLIDESILNKENLLPSEINTLKIHPYTTVGLLDDFEFSEVVKTAILHHHEKYDGTGYPDRLKGDQIPLISRVLAVVDAFCAMISMRPYRKSFTEVEALHEINNCSGTFYDPKVVNALNEIMSS